jgi:hypothetical protein
MSNHLILILIMGLLYVASYIFSMNWFIKTNFLDDLNGELTVGTLVHYAVYSLAGPFVCLIVFFSWLLKHDIWIVRVKDIRFKPRHIIQFIPLIGLFGVTILVVIYFMKTPKLKYQEYFQYVWYNRTCYYISMFWHAIFVFIFL